MPMPADPAKNVFVRSYNSIFAGVRFSLVRVVDERTEASGFATSAEAEQWAEDNGYRVYS